jgi:hypothetical protein
MRRTEELKKCSIYRCSFKGTSRALEAYWKVHSSKSYRLAEEHDREIQGVQEVKSVKKVKDADYGRRT